MKFEEIADEAIESIQRIAGMAARHIDDENPGASMLALIITAYTRTVGDYVERGFVTLDEALDCTAADLEIVQQILRERLAESVTSDLTS